MFLFIHSFHLSYLVISSCIFFVVLLLLSFEGITCLEDCNRQLLRNLRMKLVQVSYIFFTLFLARNHQLVRVNLSQAISSHPSSFTSFTF